MNMQIVAVLEGFTDGSSFFLIAFFLFLSLSVSSLHVWLKINARYKA